MFILKISVDSSSSNDEAERTRKTQEKERIKKQKEAEQQTALTKKRAEQLSRTKDSQRSGVDRTKVKQGVTALSSQDSAGRIRKSAQSSNQGSRFDSRSHIATLESEKANLDPKDPNYATDKAILDQEISFHKKAQKSNSDFEQKEQNAKLKQQYGGTKHYGSDVNLDPGVQKQREKLNAKADRAINDPAYRAHLVHERNHTSTFGDPSLNSWGRDRIRLANMGSNGGSVAQGGSRSELAGGDIDFKNAKGAVRHLGGDMYYAPNKNKPNDVYKIEHNPMHGLNDRHDVVKKMYDGTLDESEAKKLGVTMQKTDYKQEYAQHMDNKAKGILSPKQRDAKVNALASARERRTFLEGRLGSPNASRNPVLAAKLQAKMDRVDALIARQESALTKSDEAIAKRDAESESSVDIELTAKPNQSERLDAISGSLDSAIASRSVSGINSALSELSGVDSDSKASVVSRAEAAKTQIQKDATRNIA